MDEIKVMLERLENKMNALLRLETNVEAVLSLDCINDILKQKQLSVADIADMYKISRSSIYESYRYVLPNYGIRAPEEKGHLKFSMQEVLDWNKIPVEKRKQEWEELTNLKNIKW